MIASMLQPLRSYFACMAIAVSCTCIGQATMNCQFTDGTLALYELSTLDSVAIDTAAAPPMLRIYRNAGADLNIIASQVDSLTYSPGGATGTPLLATRSPEAVTGDCAIVSTYMAYENGSAVTANGVCWGTSLLPTISDNVAASGFLLGNSDPVLTGLSPNTTYYARAYATNGNGTAYGNQVSFTTTNTSGDSWLLPGTGTGVVTDVDGNSYATVAVNGTVWMAENLRTTRYANGNLIGEVTDNSAWTGLSAGAWCRYNNNPVFEVPYGKLYNRFAVTDPRNVCPTGWHVPSDAEWTTLTDAFGGLTLAGNALKSLFLWSSLNGSTTNASGFSAVPGGNRLYNFGDFDALGNTALYWSATDFSATSGWGRSMDGQSFGVTRTSYGNRNGLSVRCVQD